MKALIIDDEKRAVSILRILIERHLPEVHEIETALGAEAGLQIFAESTPDIIFLDIEMPQMTGFEFLEQIRSINPKVPVIFTTAYDQYAIKAIRFSAVDYLLKPIDVDELKAAWNRFMTSRAAVDTDRDRIYANLLSNIRSMHIGKPRLAVATQGGAVFFDISEIVHCEADNNYTVFHLTDGRRFVASRTLKDYENMLDEYDFLRVHQSHLVNPEFIKQYTQKGLLELTTGQNIYVSRRKHNWLLVRLKELYQ